MLSPTEFFHESHCHLKGGDCFADHAAAGTAQMSERSLRLQLLPLSKLMLRSGL
jgi:hypothetical protein